ncbi:MAG: aldo/keto reductase [Spirochaetales bacterium]|nr:aldo/keto reductase [Spirochaetales bacterium]
MKYKLLGKTGVSVSELCFGTMTFGREADEGESRNMFRLCLDRGINIFDCANVYSRGGAEELLGRFVKETGNRNDLILTSKVGFAMGDGGNRTGSSRRHIMGEIDESLRRLQTDRLDVYFIHNFDPLVDMEETLRALDDLVRAGKVVYTGVSNWAAWQIMKALGISREKVMASFSCVQPMYNLLKRQAEVEILPLCQSEKLGVISYSPIAGGLLSGKYGIDEGKGRISDDKMYAARYSRAGNREIAGDVARIAGEIGCHPASLAVKWVLYGNRVTAPIIGARSVEQLNAGLASVDVPMDDALYERITSLTEDPPPATDRLEVQVMKKG